MINHRRRGLTLAEIGVEYGITRERVRQLLKQYGGPSTKTVRNAIAAERQRAQDARALTIAARIKCVLAESGGPMTTSEVAEITGIDASDISKNWPEDCDHLRLWTAAHRNNRWSDEEILQALREASLYEFPLTTTAYTGLLRLGQVDGPSVPRIFQRFGAWSVACEQAGVVAGDPWNREYESKWSDDELLQFARAYMLDPTVPNSAHRFDGWKRENAPDGPSMQTLRNRFGSWTEVKKRALAPGEMTQ